MKSEGTYLTALLSVSMSFLLLVLPACWDSKKEDTALKNNLVIINVLDKQLYDDCHIKGSINVSMADLAQYARALPKDVEIVVYCSNYMCSASGYACKQLKDMDFKHVWAYEGGTAQWYQKGLPVEGPSNSSYLSKVIEEPAHDNQERMSIITADELLHKIANAGVAQVTGKVAA